MIGLHANGGDVMSEELLQTAPKKIGRYSYHRLGATSIAQLARAGIVSGRPPKTILKNRPDGLVVLGKGAVKAWIEYKTPEELKTANRINRAIQQASGPASHLCNLLIVSDGQNTHWINPHTRNRIRTDQVLPVFDAKSISADTATVEYRLGLEKVVDQADHSLSPENDELRTPSLMDPSGLAQRIWQKIWINTGKEPEKCLYNVVELFVFKFLSDLSVLDVHNDFENVCGTNDRSGHAAALASYANMSRPAVRSLFPEGPDGTGIINGTIFVNEKGEANNSQARLFCEVLEDLREYDRRHGSFRYIAKDFKTRLYESFLRQGAGLHHLGQFFTPRNVVQAVVGMSGANALPSGASICDPFCGVGGFLLEAILQSPRLMARFRPRDGVIAPDATFIGYDRGSDEKEDERTIILAKANALIYFSDLVSRHNTADFADEFANKVINRMFTLVRDNLGTFGIDDADCYDLILTNPPYVTSGSGSLKTAISEEGLEEMYPASGRGTESLALQWIVRSLKPGGTAIVIVPDGLLNQTGMLDFVKQRCVVKALVSLPVRTFYATPKKTYILVVSRKTESEGKQAEPVFAYLVSEIGETRDANRWSIPENDLSEAVALYNQFKGSPGTFKSSVRRCKVVPWRDFDALEHWMLDRRCWNSGELQALGIEPEPEEACSIQGFNKLLRATGASPVAWGGEISGRFAEVSLGDEALFSLHIGKRVLRKDCVEHGIPCISANVRDVFGYVHESTLIRDFSVPSLTWGIDGVFDWCLIPVDFPFHPTDHCGVLRVSTSQIDTEYLYHVLRATRDRHGFDRTYRANLQNVGRVSVDVPVSEDGSFDLDRQCAIAATYREIEERKEHVRQMLGRIAAARVSFL